MPLAGDFRAKGEANALYPLAVDGCASCGLLQVRDLVDPRILFHSSYSYASSTVPALVDHFRAYADSVALPPAERGKRLLEVGCNDGVFLVPLQLAGYEVSGVEASSNVAHLAQAKGLPVQIDFFGSKLAKAMKASGGPVDVVTCSNVFAHNPSLDDFVEGIRELLDPQRGEFWVEVHSAHSLYANLQWDCFYHEHCFYWTIHALSKYLASRGLYLRRYRMTPMHGGAIRAVFGAARAAVAIEEEELGRPHWTAFNQRCQRSREIIHETIRALPIRYAFGAAGRAVTLINWCDLKERLQFVVDGSSLRHGRVIPNTEVPIISEEVFAASVDINDWCFVTAHNYLPGIAAKVRKWFPQKPVKFVTPLPNVVVQ
jgi:SAM-dependent methyltransferase